MILTIPGIRINELSSWISISRSKPDPSSHKAYLTSLGKKLVDKRQQDFEILFSMKKLDNSIFPSEKNHYKPLRRDRLTKEVNFVLQNLTEKLPNKPNLTVDFISQLWRDTNDIEFVRQAIGHIKVESTSSYVENLSDQERKLRMEQITSRLLKN